MDICLSTQTNDVVGWVRTTGKLPLYLAAGRYVLASRVGEAARVLPEEMLVDGMDPSQWVAAALRTVVNWNTENNKLHQYISSVYSYVNLSKKITTVWVKK
jgi:hypothetical protein